MKLRVFALRDNKADAFGSPFFVPNDAIARRMVGELVQDKRTEVGKYPAEFAVYEIGTFDPGTGVMVGIQPTVVCSVLSCMPKPDPRQLLLAPEMAQADVESVPLSVDSMEVK